MPQKNGAVTVVGKIKHSPKKGEKDGIFFRSVMTLREETGKSFGLWIEHAPHKPAHIPSRVITGDLEQDKLWWDDVDSRYEQRVGAFAVVKRAYLLDEHGNPTGKCALKCFYQQQDVVQLSEIVASEVNGWRIMGKSSYSFYRKINENTKMYLVMPWVEGENLYKVAINPRYSFMDRMAILENVLNKVEALNESGMIFTDLKLENIMLRESQLHVSFIDPVFSTPNEATKSVSLDSLDKQQQAYFSEHCEVKLTPSDQVYMFGRIAWYLLRCLPGNEASKAEHMAQILLKICCADEPEKRAGIAELKTFFTWKSPERARSQFRGQHQPYASSVVLK